METSRLAIQGTQLSVTLAGKPDRSALLLIHGFPSSSRSFRKILDTLDDTIFVVAPDLPGFGASDPIAEPSFEHFADMVERLLEQLGVEFCHLYLHDYGAAVGLDLALRAPHRIRSLIIQNANAHATGIGPQWDATKRYWSNPTPATEKEATAHLTFEGTRDQYIGGIPADIAERMDRRAWDEDWSVMSRPGRLAMHRRLVLDYRNHVARFDEIADYLGRHQPPALMMWGRHDSFFAIDETLSWMKALPRMEAHVLDGAHFLLETHAAQCATLMSAFLGRISR